MESPITLHTQFALLREWLRWCDNSHSCYEAKTFVPTRLLYVGNTNDTDILRLDLAVGTYGATYVALYHRWGVLSDEEKKIVLYNEE